MSRLVERILNAPARNAPYWEILEYCRHLGIQKRTLESGYWVARIRNKSGGYKQRRLMPWYADEDSEAVALGLAREWFSSPEVARIASDPIPKGSRQTLIYCPWGDVYTLGHALKDYAAWKRIAATKSHYDSLMSLINHHILPRIGQVPLEHLNGRHITDFSLQIWKHLQNEASNNQ